MIHFEQQLNEVEKIKVRIVKYRGRTNRMSKRSNTERPKNVEFKLNENLKDRVLEVRKSKSLCFKLPKILKAEYRIL